jgi:hypothetical protein
VVEQAIEIVAAIMVLAAFGLAQFRGLDLHGYPYLTLNFGGTAVLAVIAAMHQQWGFLLLQGVWALVALKGLIALARNNGLAA